MGFKPSGKRTANPNSRCAFAKMGVPLLYPYIPHRYNRLKFKRPPPPPPKKKKTTTKEKHPLFSEVRQKLLLSHAITRLGNVRGFWISVWPRDIRGVSRNSGTQGSEFTGLDGIFRGSHS